MKFLYWHRIYYVSCMNTPESRTHILAMAICTNSKVIPIYISEMDITNGDDFSVIIWKCKQTNWRITNIFSTSFSGNKIEINQIWLARKQCLSETCLNNVGDLVAVIFFCCSNSVYESRVYVIALYVIASTYYYKRFELYLFHSTVGLQISERNFKSNQALKMRWAKIHHFAVLYNTNFTSGKQYSDEGNSQSIACYQWTHTSSQSVVDMPRLVCVTYHWQTRGVSRQK